ncbi:MAG TPA: MASE1 domain-containing protein [Candidatus Angelobacter sp.]
MIQASDEIGPRKIGKYLALTLIVLVSYFLAGKLGQATTAIRSGNIGPVWPAFGVALAAVLLYGYRVWPGIFIGVFLVDFLSPVPVVAALGQASGATLAAITGAFFLRRIADFESSFSRLRDALGMIVLGAFGSALISATIGVSVLYATHVEGYSGLGPAWLIYWLGDATGGLLVTPLVLTFVSLLKIRRWDRLAELATLLLLLTLTSVAIFTDNVLVSVKLHVMAFAVLPFVIWAAIRFGISGASLATLLVASIATVETGLGYGPFTQNTAFTNAVLLDIFFTVLSVSGMVLAAFIAEREHDQNERERQVREQAAMEARLRLAAIVEASEDAIFVTDISGIVTDWNKGAEKLYGYTADEIIGQSIFLLIPSDRSSICARAMEKVQQGHSLGHSETVRRKKDGELVAISITASPIFTPEGKVVGLSAIERDITERKRQETILRNNEERLRLAAHAGKMFAYEWDAATDVIVRSEESANILGIDQSVRLTGEQALGRVHPDDREKVAAAMAALSVEDPSLKISYRILRPDDTEIWVEQNSLAHFDEQGSILRTVGMVADITEHKRAEAALSSAKRRLIEAQEQERTRIARELHDDIGQRLALLTIELNQLYMNANGLPAEVLNSLEQLGRQSAEIAADTQSLSHELHSARLEYLGITAAMKGFCREFSEKQHVEIDFKNNDVPGSLPPDISLCLFRILQEALHNSAKHSGAESFVVRLWGSSNEICLSVRDSGAGFDSETVKESHGIGLISMEERLAIVNGTLYIDSHPNIGTTIYARVPFNAEREPLSATG